MAAVNGIYYYSKKGKQPNLVFLHGWGGDSNVWRFMKQALATRNISFLAVDLRGHGLSVRLNKPGTMKEYAQDIKAILDKEKITQAVIVGHCFGGMVAQELALTYPNRVQQLVLVATNCKLPTWMDLGELFFPLIKLIKTKPKFRHRDYTKFKGSSDIGLVRIYSDIIHAGTFSYFSIYRGIKNWDIEKQLKNVKAPVLIIAGREDTIFPQSVQIKLNQSFKQARLKFLATNHLVPVNAAKQLEEIILKEVIRPES
jgi:3-oxoadipate enol-lactonase